MSENLMVMEPQIVRPLVKVKELIAVQEELNDILAKALAPGVDYGFVPGSKKPSLFKAGAERLCKVFGAKPRYTVEESTVDHNYECIWEKKKYDKYKKQWIHESGRSLGLYRFVVKCSLYGPNGELIAEQLASCSTLESKFVDRPRDTENTVLKMAQKRAFVGAVLNSFGLSDRFTQDMEDFAGKEEPKNELKSAVSPSPNDLEKMKQELNELGL